MKDKRNKTKTKVSIQTPRRNWETFCIKGSKLLFHVPLLPPPPPPLCNQWRVKRIYPRENVIAKRRASERPFSYNRNVETKIEGRTNRLLGAVYIYAQNGKHI